MSISKQDDAGFAQAIEAIRQQAVAGNQRAVIVLSGDDDWCHRHAATVEELYSASTVEWSAKQQPEAVTIKQHFHPYIYGCTGCQGVRVNQPIRCAGDCTPGR